jgi:chemotaxis protein CheD
MKETDSLVPENYLLAPGFIYVAIRPAMISAALGSCVSICLFDRKRNVGGMNHFQYPVVREKEEARACYGNVAALALVRMMYDDGSKVNHLEAQIFGGAFNRSSGSRDIGKENINIARRVLRREKIAIVSEDVGGEKGRKIVFNTATNEVAVIRVAELRAGDWYPYEGER